jgi:hypothetical protein
MSRLTNIIGASLLAISLYGCGSVDRGSTVPNPDSLKIDKVDPSDSKAYQKVLDQKMRICEDIKTILKKDDEFDKITCNLMETKEGKDLILAGYYNDKWGNWEEWGINLDNLCRAYQRETQFLIFDISDKACIQTSRYESFCSPSFSHDAAKQMTEIFRLYLGNNGERCTYWVQFNQENRTPLNR